MTGEATYMLEDTIASQLLAGFTGLTREVAELRGAIVTRVDGMDHRMLRLELDMRRLVSDAVAQDVITPKVLKDLGEMETSCATRHERLDAAITVIEKTLARDDGRQKGQAKYLSNLWVALCAMAAVVAWMWHWLWEGWFSKWLPGVPK